jgi:hypothetical protein
MTALERHDAALRAGLRRWDGVSKDERSQQARAAVLARWQKARNRERTSAADVIPARKRGRTAAQEEDR